MPRVASALVLSAGLLVTSRVLAPAAPPAAPPIAAGELAAIDQAAPLVAQVDQQVDRLRERLTNPPQYPAPARDPFRFGRPPEPVRPKTAPPVEPASPVPVAPVLPRLVAIVADAGGGGLTRKAVFAVGDDVQIVKAGDVVAKFLVRNVGDDVVELADPQSGATFRLSLH